MQRLGLPEEVASAVAFLGSDDASFIIRVALPVDGGFLARRARRPRRDRDGNRGRETAARRHRRHQRRRRLPSDAPFGGFKASGIGREYGEWGVREFLQPQHVQWSLA
jgi:hypothetical protein